MLEIAVGGVTLTAAVSGLQYTVKKIIEVYRMNELRVENKNTVNVLEGILGFVGPALAEIAAREEQFAEASKPALSKSVMQIILNGWFH